MIRNDIVDLYNCLYGRRKPPCLSGAMYQRVAEAPPTALESAEIPGLTHHVSDFLIRNDTRTVFQYLFFGTNRIAFLKWIWKLVSKAQDSGKMECLLPQWKL